MGDVEDGLDLDWLDLDWFIVEHGILAIKAISFQGH